MADNKETFHSLETRRTLLEERDAHIERARIIAAQCNSVLPIAKLPAEILLRILTINTVTNNDKQPNRRESRRPIDPTRDTRRAGQVCQYWRQLVLGSPTLWNLLLNCNFTPPLWVAEIVSRSGSLPLKLTVNFFSNHIRRSATNFRMVLPHLNHLGELEAFCGDIKNVRDILFKRLREPMPMLRTLTLTSGDYEAEEREDMDDLESWTSDTSNFEAMLRNRNPYLPPFPFEDSCQILKLKTSGYLFRLDSPVYRNLAHLAIYNINGQVPKISEWSTLICTLENLVSLTLVDVFTKTDDTEPTMDIELPQLRSLRISGSFIPCSLFLLHISVPTLHAFDFSIRSVNLNSPLADRVLDNILSHLYRQQEIRSPQSLRAVVSKKSITLADFESEGSPPCLFQVHLGYPPVAPKDFWHSLIPALKSRVGKKPFGSLEYKQEGSIQFPPIMVQFLIALMAPYISIPALKIKFDLWGVFVLPLFMGLLSDDLPAPLFPLSSPQIYHITIRAMAWQMPNACELLHKFVTWRHESGNCLDIVHFKRSSEVNPTTTMPEACANLKPFCGKLIWEGRRNRYRNHRFSSDLDTDDSMNEGLYGGDSDDIGW